MSRLYLLILLAALSFCGAAQAAPSSYNSTGTSKHTLITVSGTQLLDSMGRPITFHGINVCSKPKDQKYQDNISSADFAQIRSWGMNAVRLCIFWDRLEPRPGELDRAYLDRVANLVNEARQQGLYVLLDMHQDLYSVKFGDGAPLWATLDDGKPFTRGGDWSDAYYVSEAVQSALDHFWSNSAGPDGIGLQDHYAKAWQFVATRFRNEPAVLGYDLMNEPFPGRDAQRLELAMLNSLSTSLRQKPNGPHPSTEDLIQMEGMPEGRRQITSWMSSMSLFEAMLEAGTPIMQDFDRSRLMPMYSRVRKAIRQVDKRHAIFLEPAMSANLGIPTAITPLVDDAGQRDPQQVFSPHVYDIVVDTALLDLMSKDRIKLIVDRERQFSVKSKMPMFVGEWGAFYSNPASTEVARYIGHLFTLAGCSDIYWDYQPDMTHWAGLDALKRPTGHK